MFNWMFGQLRKTIGRSYVRGRAPNLNRLSRARSTSPSAQFNIRAILSRVYVQSDARPIEKGYREIVCSWKNSELESAEQSEGKCHKPSPSAQFSVRAIPNRVYVQLDARPIEEGCRKVVYSSEASNLNRLSRARKERSSPQPNSVFVQFSVVYMFNWMLGQLRKGYGKIVS